MDALLKWLTFFSAVFLLLHRSLSSVPAPSNLTPSTLFFLCTNCTQKASSTTSRPLPVSLFIFFFFLITHKQSIALFSVPQPICTCLEICCKLRFSLKQCHKHDALSEYRTHYVAERKYWWCCSRWWWSSSSSAAVVTDITSVEHVENIDSSFLNKTLGNFPRSIECVPRNLTEQINKFSFSSTFIWELGMIRNIFKNWKQKEHLES